MKNGKLKEEINNKNNEIALNQKEITNLTFFGLNLNKYISINYIIKC